MDVPLEITRASHLSQNKEVRKNLEENSHGKINQTRNYVHVVDFGRYKTVSLIVKKCRNELDISI